MKTFKILFGLLVIFGFSGCMNNDFLERYPLGSPTAETVFKSYDNFKTYAWGLYETFPALGYGETNTDNISYNSTRGSGELSFPRQKQTIHHGHNIHSSAGQTSCSTISRRRI